jgi:hypothetical protein
MTLLPAGFTWDKPCPHDLSSLAHKWRWVPSRLKPPTRFRIASVLWRMCSRFWRFVRRNRIVSWSCTWYLFELLIGCAGNLARSPPKVEVTLCSHYFFNTLVPNISHSSIPQVCCCRPLHPGACWMVLIMSTARLESPRVTPVGWNGFQDSVRGTSCPRSGRRHDVSVLARSTIWRPTRNLSNNHNTHYIYSSHD